MMKPHYLTRSRIEHALGSRSPIQCTVPGLRPAAVLVPLFSIASSDSPRVWLFERTDDGGAHAGQVALPGGKPSGQDADLVATALREAWEELGIPPEAVEILGLLDDYPTITGFRIRPVVGWIPSTFTPIPSPGEVARFFSAPLSLFLGPGTRGSVRWANANRRVRVFEVDGAIVWGATAAILQGFAELLNASDAAESG